jgi:hypothetical protein
MRRLAMTVASAVVMGLGVDVSAQAPAKLSLGTPVTRTAKAQSARIEGRVTDDRGAPLQGAMVSALGATTALAVTDSAGQFTFIELPPGPYLLRAHLQGFGASRRVFVALVAGGAARQSFKLARAATPAPLAARPILAAGVGARAEPGSSEETAAADATTTDHDHTDTAWRLRHLKRSVLKDTETGVSFAPESDIFGTDSGRSFFGTVTSPARFAASLFSDMPLTGQVNLLTVTAFDHPKELLSLNQRPRGLAYVSIGAPAGFGEWAMQGAMIDGDVASWMIAGSYTSRATATHAFDVGLSYTTQYYGGGNPAALVAVTDGSRNVGTLHGYDRWAISPRATLSYGSRYAWYDYLDGAVLFSPEVGVSVSPFARTRVRVSLAQRMLAPGAEEFTPPAAQGLWLPPERTFAPIGAALALRAERARGMELGVEQDVGDAYVVGLTRFHTDVNDQLATVFGHRLSAGSRGDIGHYYVANAGNVTGDGWRVSLGRTVAGRVQGTVDYTVTNARWSPLAGAALLGAWAPSAARQGLERVHDVTTSITTAIPETATRVFAVYRFNTAYSQPDADMLPGTDVRFDVQITQALPFLPFSASQWEVLVAVRNLFRDPLDHGVSPYDELLVVRPPKRVVGGVTVKF